MKRLIISTLAFLSTVLLTIPAFASAATSYYWQYQISSLPAYTTTHSFNVQYTVLSSQQNTNFKVQLYQSTDGGTIYTACGPQIDTINDPNPNSAYGNSGAVPACVSTDGTYKFKFVVTPDTSGGTDVSSPNQTTSTIVDTTPPPTPIYAGKTQSGNTYKLSFSEPSGDNTTSIIVYASTSKTYTADSSTQVSPALDASAISFSYTASDSQTRYFSLQAFDAAGNGSSLVGDPGVIVHPTVFTNLNGNGVPNVAAAQAAAATPPAAGQVQGATTTTPNTSSTGTNTGGQVNAPGGSSTSKNKGKVLGTEITVPNSKTGWYVGGGIALIILILTYWFVLRGRIFNRNRPQDL